MQRIRVKNVRHDTEIAVVIDHAPSVNCDPAANLPPMLQGIQGEIGEMDGVKIVFIINTKNTAFFMGLIKHCSSS